MRSSPAELLKREQTTASRLFAVDAALDAGELRNKYPARSRYAITRARIGVNFYAGSATTAAQLTGRLSEIVNDRISVPPEFRTTFASLPRASTWGEAATSRFEATIAFGKRFEPWFVAASSADK